MKFKDLKFVRHHVPDLYEGKAVVRFANGYGASIIYGPPAYADHTSPRKYELAVLKGDALCYDTEITDDVIGYLDEAGVERLLAEIEALPGHVPAEHAKTTFKYTCPCGWHGHENETVTVDVAERRTGEHIASVVLCPECYDVESSLVVACDHPECWGEVAGGTETQDGCRLLCSKHLSPITTRKE